jgi:hypothetical protein
MSVNGPSRPALTLRLDPLLYIAICLAVFAGFQGGRYYLANRLQELGIACALLLFVVGAWRALFRLDQREWQRWTGLPMLLIGGIMGISALVFTMNYEGRFLYSAFSAREFLLAFLGPGIYLLCRCGLSREAVERCLWISFVALMLNYLFFYFTMDLRAAFFSSDHTVSNLVTYDEWRGFRLKPPLFAIMVALLASLALLRSAASAWVRIGALLTIGLAAWIWSIVLFRSTLATMLLSVLLYPVFLSHRNRASLIVVLVPLGLIAAPIVAGLAVENFLGADGGSIRARAFAQAFAHIPQHPLFGAGEDSAYGDSYQDIVAPYFFPSDLGLVGVTYKYGVLGVLLYLFMHGRIWLRLWQANIAAREEHGRGSPLLWSFLIFMTAQTFNLALNPGLAYAQGITAGTLALALASLALQSRASRRPAPGLAPRSNRTILGAGAVCAA